MHVTRVHMFGGPCLFVNIGRHFPIETISAEASDWLTTPTLHKMYVCTVQERLTSGRLEFSVVPITLPIPPPGAYDGKRRGLHEVSCRIEEQLAVPNHQDSTRTRDTNRCL
jgi:hypothetical protein